MNQGKKFTEGTPEQIFQHGEELVELGLDLPFAMKMSKLMQEMGSTYKMSICQKKSW